ncbi:uncharacterized protein LOC135717333 [Ochlerotatus camptorhynchus]|uniref:uncharacterized protein LOC135717333 n=1 Tax=Ochlerotatus camptorhynchus TaxID=644619 RepID=UPI0031D2A237
MDFLSFLPKLSSFRIIQRVVGYVLRFTANCQKKDPTNREIKPHLTVRELRRSSEVIMQVLQKAHFSDENKLILANKPCKRLGGLRPIYHDGQLRVGGRLDRSQLPFESRHPIILPDKDPVVRLLIQQMHVELLHVGQTGLMNVMRQRYWLLNARSTIRFITHRCVRCFRTNRTTPNQLIGNLPVSRVVPSPPFAVTGVDYAGPFWTKQGTRRPTLVKSYVAVYVCMATKAVHLEGVSDLSTDAFMASLRRFIARRGMVQEIHSDNATNFEISNDPADPLVITPAHYLIGRPLIVPAEPSLENVKASRLTRWQHLQLMREQFWRAWSRDYLNTQLREN